jgi:DNA replication factor GINS
LQYLTLYETWKKEKESSALQSIRKGFYTEASALIREQKDETQILDERSLRAQLLAKQQVRANRVLKDLVEIRFKKICHIIINGETPSIELLTSEEENIVNSLMSVKDEFDRLLKVVLSGRPPHVKKAHIGEASRRIMVRFMQDIPSIVGANARTYGPFKAEDIATLPAENAESLIKRGVALRVEVE